MSCGNSGQYLWNTFWSWMTIFSSPSVNFWNMIEVWDQQQLELFYLSSHRLKWSILKWSQGNQTKMLSFKTGHHTVSYKLRISGGFQVPTKLSSSLSLFTLFLWERADTIITLYHTTPQETFHSEKIGLIRVTYDLPCHY